jgi:signal transduction histidine kinase
MVCNDLVMPVLLRSKRWMHAQSRDLTRLLLNIRRAAIVLILLLGYAYYHLAGEAYALVSIGLISFAAVAQFAPALLGGMYWKGGTRQGAMAGLVLGFAMWAYTLMLPSLAKSGWMSDAFLVDGLFGNPWLRPEAFLGLTGLDNLTHSLFWSMLFNVGAYVVVSLWRTPSARETSQALLFVDVFERTTAARPVFWRGQAHLSDLLPLAERFLGPERARAELQAYAQRQGVQDVQQLQADARLVQFIETQLAGAIGSASARVMVASVVKEESLDIDDVMDILEEATRLRIHSKELEEKSRSLELATAELRAANEQLKSLDKLKDDFMSSVTHELRTPLTAIRALSEMMHEDPKITLEDRKRFLGIIVSESERLSRLVNQVLDLAKIESGHAEWHNADLDLVALVRQSAQTVTELLREKHAVLELDLPPGPVVIRADADRLTQVMLNLMSNAAKFVPAETGRVRVRLFVQDDRVVVEVQDNGPGVPEAQQELVFEKFRQGGDGLHRPQGTGLGLPISRQIVEHFGGRMWLRSTAGQGACFGFDLPLHPEPADGPAPSETGDRA